MTFVPAPFDLRPLANFYVREHWDTIERMDRFGFGGDRTWERRGGVCWVGVKPGDAFSASVDPRDGVMTFFGVLRYRPDDWQAGLGYREQRCIERENDGHGAHRQSAIIDRAEGNEGDDECDC